MSDGFSRIVALVRVVKAGMGRIKGCSIVGVPLDLPVRFALLGLVYLVLSSWVRSRHAALAVIAVLLLSEVFEVVDVRDIHTAVAPDWGDAADVLSGLAGIAAAEVLRRRFGLHNRLTSDHQMETPMPGRSA